MLTTTRSHPARAARIRERWPSCSAPIVGTKPTRTSGLDSARNLRIDAIVRACSMALLLEEVAPHSRLSIVDPLHTRGRLDDEPECLAIDGNERRIDRTQGIEMPADRFLFASHDGTRQC